ncbi:ArsR/SmtB family transcription factor [Brucella anthropi]|uniref:ArsR/SmtB family transcription factor n=1 Tax=Brucella anthropi TaxID=529 RepID=UPI0023629E87|nr:metalloregulator ArsR/SmtB family transcription factor [Brucella anthropi]
MPSIAVIEDLVENVDRAQLFLSALGNAKRVQILCILLNGEMSVGALAKAVRLSLSALSQHLATLKYLDIVSTRREAQTIFYRVASPHIERILTTLFAIYIEQAQSRAARSVDWTLTRGGN